MKRSTKRTAFHKVLLALVIAHDVPGGIHGLSRITGIAYMTLRDRLRLPRTLRWYEFLSIVESLRLNDAEEASLIAAIKEA